MITWVRAIVRERGLVRFVFEMLLVARRLHFAWNTVEVALLALAYAGFAGGLRGGSAD